MTSNTHPIIDTEYGPVQGVLKTTALGRNFYDFRVVPYMKAPIGKLRFRDAQPPDQWSEPFNTNIERPTYFCPPFPPFPADGQEDAGIVSVSTPYLDRKLPVLVYIHGGGFQIASGKLNLFGGDYLLQKDIVFVTINYRVGPIGFLSLKDPELDIPGNAGLKDQVFALKWVQRNIAKFGGDPENVTIFGTSAGGVSVHMLMMTDLARGLFKKAIPMSGTAFIKAWPFAAKNNLTERLASSLGWDGKGGERGILEVLENADAKELVVAESKLLTTEERFINHTPFPFTPVIEPYVNEKTFLAKDPVLMGREAWSNSIDCMIGGTSLEGGMMMLWLIQAKLEELFKDPAHFTLTRELGLDITIPKDKEKATEYGSKLKSFYFGDSKPSMDTLKEYLSYAGDLHFWHGIYRAVLSRLHSNGTGKTFFLSIRFEYKFKLYEAALSKRL
ncbi:esterase B1-like [Bradysia coprophila]|uniref:esterase B1-like n=1 Tax=Bradysia coprophila TaxID=38358 RepID=UPI00187D89BE|nr:esterase B1-like [Bradysia coprophila]